MHYVSVVVFLSIILLASTVSISDAHAIKAKGTLNQKFGAKTVHVVCGDKLCSEITRDGATSQQSRFGMGGVSLQGMSKAP